MPSTLCSKIPTLRDNPVLPGTNKYGDPQTEDKYNKKLPEMHDTFSRACARWPTNTNAVLIGETWTKNVEELKEYYGDHNDELQMPMDFLFTKVDELSPAEFRQQIAGVESLGRLARLRAQQSRHRALLYRYGDGQHNDEIAKLMAGPLPHAAWNCRSCTTAKRSAWRTTIH